MLAALPNLPAADVPDGEDEDGNVTMVPVMVDGAPVVSQAALRLRDELVTHLACLPAVPGVLDAVLEALGTEQVAEITGRNVNAVKAMQHRALANLRRVLTADAPGLALSIMMATIRERVASANRRL